MKIKYKAFDGRKFDKERDCRKYNLELLSDYTYLYSELQF